MDLTARAVAQKPITAILWQGVLVEVLNPKTVMFFALFLPPFVALEHGSSSALDVTIQLLILGSLVPLTALPSDILVAFLGGAMTKTLQNNHNARAALAVAAGLLLILIAFSLHWQTLLA